MRIVWSPRAEADLTRIQTYLASHSPRGASRVGARILKRVIDQADMPLAAPFERDGPTRRLTVTRTPYVVMYDVVGDELQVLAIYHADQQRP